MNQVYTVTEVNRYVKNMFAREAVLDNITIQGEISNCKYHSSGHIYFTLKDSGSRLACVMFAGNRRGLDFTMQDGMSVVVAGSVNVYERDGKYQLYATHIFRDGFGKLYERLEMLKEKLLAEGLFSDIHKQKIPFYSGTVGIVTAKTGAAIQDIINVSHRRNPYVQLYLYPAIVQGDEAAVSIAEGIEALDKLGLDVIIVGRGGGSFEDLFAFNEEVVVRAIYNCKTPVISAVGHEVDTTLSDYVADMRAPTPSAAAEIAVKDISEIYGQLDEYARILKQLMLMHMNNKRNNLRMLASRLNYQSPDERIKQKRLYLDSLDDKINSLMKWKLERYRQRMQICVEKMKVLSPLHRLSGGYSYVTDGSGEALKSVKQVSTGDTLRITVTDGTIDAHVVNVNNSEIN